MRHSQKGRPLPMLKKSPARFLSLLLILPLSLGLAGCQSAAENSDPEMEKLSADMNSAAKRAGGDYKKLAPAEKEQFLKMSSGNEGAAKNLVHALSGSAHEEWKGSPPPGGNRPGSN
jgi:hypothetical protein